MSKKKNSWHKVSDSSIRHRWDLDCDCKPSGLVARSVTVSPTFYCNSGTPICEECGEDRKYIGAEMKATGRKPITITLEGGVIQAIQYIPKGMRVKVLDFDVDGVPEDELTKLRNRQKCVMSIWGKQ